LIDNVLATATVATSPKSGYFFTYAGVGAANANGLFQGYTIAANPAVQNTTGDLNYCGDQSGVTRFEVAPTVCAPTSAPIQ
jgi:hypothetical protein